MTATEFLRKRSARREVKFKRKVAEIEPSPFNLF